MENKEYVNFIKKLVEENKLEGDALKEANEMLEKNFREEVIDCFGGNYSYYYDCKNERKEFYKIKGSKTYKVDFIKLSFYDNSKKEFLMKNWNNIDKIIDVLDKYIQELEEEQKLEEEKEKQESNEGSEEVNND